MQQYDPYAQYAQITQQNMLQGMPGIIPIAAGGFIGGGAPPGFAGPPGGPPVVFQQQQQQQQHPGGPNEENRTIFITGFPGVRS